VSAGAGTEEKARLCCRTKVFVVLRIVCLNIIFCSLVFDTEGKKYGSRKITKDFPQQINTIDSEIWLLGYFIGVFLQEEK
jgi:hypothetical protein